MYCDGLSCRPKIETAEASADKCKRLHSLLAAQLFALKAPDLVILLLIAFVTSLLA